MFVISCINFLYYYLFDNVVIILFSVFNYDKERVIFFWFFGLVLYIFFLKKIKKSFSVEK